MRSILSTFDVQRRLMPEVHLCSSYLRRNWAPLSWRWLWTGTSPRLCCLSWPAVLRSSPVPDTTRNWSTPRCRASTGSPKDVRSPKPRGTWLKSVCWLSAGTRKYLMFQYGVIFSHNDRWFVSFYTAQFKVEMTYSYIISCFCTCFKYQLVFWVLLH